MHRKTSVRKVTHLSTFPALGSFTSEFRWHPGVKAFGLSPKILNIQLMSILEALHKTLCVSRGDYSQQQIRTKQEWMEVNRKQVLTNNTWPLHVYNGNAKTPSTHKIRANYPLWQHSPWTNDIIYCIQIVHCFGCPCNCDACWNCTDAFIYFSVTLSKLVD